MEENFSEVLIFFVFSPLAVLIGYLVTFQRRNKTKSKIWQQNEYFFHILLLSKSILILSETFDVAHFSHHGFDGAHCAKSGQIKLLAFDAGVMFSIWYLYLFRKHIQDAAGSKKKAHVLAVISSLAVPCLHAFKVEDY